MISDNDLAKIVHINDEGNLPGFASHVVDGRYDPRGGGPGLRARLAEICQEVSAAITTGARLIILATACSQSHPQRPPKGAQGGTGGKVPPRIGGVQGGRPPRTIGLFRSRRCC